MITVSAVFFSGFPRCCGVGVTADSIDSVGLIPVQKTIAPRYAAVREDASQVNSQLSNNLSGIATIKAFTSEAFEVARVRAIE